MNSSEKTLGTPLERLHALGITLPEPPTPKGWYVPVVRTGNLVFVSGQLPLQGGKIAVTGALGGGI
jgi:enamine deaminase RidA (YjgF/YER057c/UK114 family)